MEMRRSYLALLMTISFFLAGCSDDPLADDGPADAGNDTNSNQILDDAGESNQEQPDASGGDVGDIGDDDDFLSCPPLEATQGDVVELTVDDVDDLPHMVRTAEPHTVFELASGTYSIDETLHIRADGISLRSSTDDAEDVIIDGNYDVGSLLFVNSSDVTIAHLTLKRPQYHAIHISPTADAEMSVVGSLIYGVQIFDAAQQHIKINGNSSRTAFVDEGRVECSWFELTDQGRPEIDPTATGCYTGGVDAHGARDWVVRNNDFVNIYCDGAGLAQHAVHFWTGSRDTVVDYNRIDNCARGIGLGLRQSGEARTYEDLDDHVDGHVGHYGGLIRNNFIYADIPWYDTGIEIAQAKQARVIHNTIFDAWADDKFSSIDYRFENTTVTIQNNLTGRISRRNDAQGTVSHNLEQIDATLFVDAASRDVRLVAGADDAIDAGTEVDDAGIDLLGQARPEGQGPDIGAIEFQ